MERCSIHGMINRKGEAIALGVELKVVFYMHCQRCGKNPHCGVSSANRLPNTRKT